MRARTTIIILFLAIIFVMAGNVMQVAQKNHPDEETKDTLAIDSLDTLTSDSIKHLPSDIKNLADSLADIDPLDTLDSLHRAIYLRNKALDDSIAADSANRKRKNGIDIQKVINIIVEGE